MLTPWVETFNVITVYESVSSFTGLRFMIFTSSIFSISLNASKNFSITRSSLNLRIPLIVNLYAITLLFLVYGYKIIWRLSQFVGQPQKIFLFLLFDIELRYGIIDFYNLDWGINVFTKVRLSPNCLPSRGML